MHEPFSFIFVSREEIETVDPKVHGDTWTIQL
jgi:hypothetical protein